MKSSLVWPTFVWRILAAGLPLAAYTFQTGIPVPLSQQGFAPVAVAAADFNRDGVTDIASGNLGTPVFLGAQVSTIGILLGVRSGVPGVPAELALEGIVKEIAAADFTGDGNADVLALTSVVSGSKLCLYSGTGVGTFASPVCSDLTGTPSKLTPAHLDRDGRLDVALIRVQDGGVVTMLNAGSGAFAPGPSATVALASAVAAADWNGDGLGDLAVASRSGTLTLLLSANGVLLQASQTRQITGGVTDMVAVDLNRDTRADLLLTDPQLATLTSLLSRNDPSAYLSPAVTVGFPAQGTTLRVADMNGDGVADIAASTHAGPLVIGSNADGSLQVPNPPGAQPVGTGPLAAGDVDGDGRMDLVVIAYGSSGLGVYWLRSTAVATVTALEITPASSVYGQKAMVTVRVRLAAPGAVAPLTGGSVQLLDGSTVLQTLPLTPMAGVQTDLAAAQAELLLPAGARDISARFPGTTQYLGSASAPVRTTVTPSQSFVRFLASRPADVSYTQGLRLAAGATGPLVVPNEGVISLSVNGAVISRGLVSNGETQLFIPPSMPLGKIAVQLAFEGPNFQPSVSEILDFPVTGGTVTAASAANYRPTTAPDSLAVLALPGLVRAQGAAAGAVPWPLALGGVEVETRDLAGGTRQSVGLTYAGTGQVNVHLPATTPSGARRVVVTIDGVEAAAGEIQVAPVAPGLFTADGSGTGAPAAYAALYRADGSVEARSVFSCAGSICRPLDMDMGVAGDRLVLTLFGTGWRRAGLVTATVEGRTAEVLYAGAQTETPGLDQANIVIPRETQGRGEVTVFLTGDGLATNAVRISLR